MIDATLQTSWLVRSFYSTGKRSYSLSIFGYHLPRCWEKKNPHKTAAFVTVQTSTWCVCVWHTEPSLLVSLNLYSEPEVSQLHRCVLTLAGQEEILWLHRWTNTRHSHVSKSQFLKWITSTNSFSIVLVNFLFLALEMIFMPVFGCLFLSLFCRATQNDSLNSCGDPDEHLDLRTALTLFIKLIWESCLGEDLRSLHAFCRFRSLRLFAVLILCLSVVTLHLSLVISFLLNRANVSFTQMFDSRGFVLIWAW